MHTLAPNPPRDHGGNLDAAITQYGGTRADWLDVSTGINPVPYPIPALADGDWTALPDARAQNELVRAARAFWSVPEQASVLAAPGASALIASTPYLAAPGGVHITQPTYNEHGAAFQAAGWEVTATQPADARVIVHPNNPDGRVFSKTDLEGPITIIDESFCDVMPDRSLMSYADRPGVVILKSFGKFWGLAGLRLGFAIGAPDLVQRLTSMLGPWPVSGVALRVGTHALTDHPWATATRNRLQADRARLDDILTQAGATVEGGTDLFGLYAVDDAAAWQARLAKKHVWSRIFPYSDTLIRLGLPAPDRWTQLEQAL